jgi:hypothetical protein
MYKNSITGEALAAPGESVGPPFTQDDAVEVGEADDFTDILEGLVGDGLSLLAPAASGHAASSDAGFCACHQSTREPYSAAQSETRRTP